jgi:hypothetical protein
MKMPVNKSLDVHRIGGKSENVACDVTAKNSIPDEKKEI